MIKTGDKYRHEVTYTQEGVIAFAEITGDKNPIHLDPEFAAKTPFGRPIVHGFLSASVFSKVFGMLFPDRAPSISRRRCRSVHPSSPGRNIRPNSK